MLVKHSVTTLVCI